MGLPRLLSGQLDCDAKGWTRILAASRPRRLGFPVPCTPWFTVTAWQAAVIPAASTRMPSGASGATYSSVSADSESYYIYIRCYSNHSYRKLCIH